MKVIRVVGRFCQTWERLCTGWIQKEKFLAGTEETREVDYLYMDAIANSTAHSGGKTVRLETLVLSSRCFKNGFLDQGQRFQCCPQRFRTKIKDSQI
ncbi:hypothetical protein J6590_084836 [Homalodisca vitripennis]|nr:hypothetical protein J6590_084836 [Homalodisca vitripennis]